MRNIYLCINRGRRVRDLLRLGMLDALLESGEVRIILLSPAHRVPEFTSEFDSESIVHQPLLPFQPSLPLLGVDQLAARYAHSRLSTDAWRFVQDRLWGVRPEYSQMFQQFPPDLVVTANPLYYDDAQVIYQARKQKIQTLGLMRSWDNILKRLLLRTDALFVWSPVNREEAISVEHYDPKDVYITGVPDFDLYFAPDLLVSRSEFAESWGFDPAKRILTYATVGTVKEETFLLEILLQALSDGRIREPAQLICRLHPSSRLEYFWSYRDHPKLRFSFIDKYIPTLGWTMTREDVGGVANLLHHTDVIITPGSTMTIESAIFDTPTVVPVFNAFEPEVTQKYYSKVFSRHFKRIAENKLVPVVRSVDSLLQCVNRYLQDPTLHTSQRQQLVRDYVYHTDGKSGERVANLMMKLAEVS